MIVASSIPLNSTNAERSSCITRRSSVSPAAAYPNLHTKRQAFVILRPREARCYNAAQLLKYIASVDGGHMASAMEMPGSGPSNAVAPAAQRGMSEDWLAVWIGLLVFTLSLGLLFGADLLGWAVKTS